MLGSAMFTDESPSTCGSRTVAITSGGTMALPGAACIAGVSKIAYATATLFRLQ
jgi:hypothetical protein